MAGRSHLSPDDILRFLQLRRNPASVDDITNGLHLSKTGRLHLYKMLSRLRKRRSLEELPGGRFRLTGANPSSPKPSPEPPGASPNSPKAATPPPLARGEIKGRLVLHPDGYGFVVPDSPIQSFDGDLFIPPDSTEDAMHGDRVLARLSRLTGPSGAARAEGRIIRILERANPAVVGLFRYGSRGNFVMPFDIRIQHQIEVPAGDELAPALREKLGLAGDPSGRRRLPHLPALDGAVVNVELIRFPRGGAPPAGRVIEILGRTGDLGVDTEIVIRKHRLPHEFSAEVLQEAGQRSLPVQETDLSGREDFRSLPIVTIDGETARDFDDAVYVERRSGGWQLQVHIADVAHYVRTGTPLDQEARLRGTSVYFPDRAVPMLPEALSNGICSLKPREDRLVMSAILELDASGRVRSSRMTQGVIRSAERMTYTAVNGVLEGESGACARYSSLAPHFRDMRDLALLLNARRNEHGSIDFDLPERVIQFDDQQRMTGITRSERNIAHRLIEEFMLAANRAVAAYLLGRGFQALHRVHEKPGVRKILEFEELARAFGYSLGVENLFQREVAVRHGRVPSPARAGRPGSRGHGREREMRVTLPGGAAGDESILITPRHYQRLVQKLAGKPEERIVSYLMLRSLKQARYAADSLGHFALGFDEYTHFTSPIRRYPDLIVHRILKWALQHPGSSTPPEAGRFAVPRDAEAAVFSHAQLEEISVETSEAERRAAGAERELLDWKTAQFMESHLGDEYDALIISVQKYGCFVELLDVFVEGLLPIGALEEAAGSRCVYREKDHAIAALSAHESRPRGQKAGHGRGAASSRQAWRLGDRVRVRAERIDPMRRRVEFALVS